MLKKKMKILAISILTVYSMVTFVPEIAVKAITNDEEIIYQEENDLEQLDLKALPSKYDSRSYGYVTPVRDQGQLGTCWAFGSIGALETALKKQYNKTVDYSEIHMAANNGIKGPMDGGNDLVALSYLTSWQGPVLESDDPYPNPPIPSNVNSNSKAKPQYHIQNAILSNDEASVTEIKEMVYKYGATTTGVASRFINRTNGATNNNSSFWYTDHEVLIVGWDDNYSRNNFTNKPTKDGAFICKNSWGTGFADKGYIYISYEDKSLLGDTHLSFNKVEGVNNYGNIYGGILNADLSKGMSYWFTSKNKYYVYQMNTLGAGEKISAVGIFIPENSGSIKIRYVDNFDEDSFGSYLSLPVIKTIQTSKPGYYTVKLDKPITPKNKENYAFFVEVPETNSNYSSVESSDELKKMNKELIKDNLLNQTFKQSAYAVKNGTAVYAGRVYTEANTPNTSITSFTTSVASGAKVGTKIKVSANATLSNSEFEFYAKESNSTSWTKLKGMGPANYAYWTPTKTGTYTLRVRAKGPNSTNSYDSYKDITFKVTSQTTTTIKTLSTSVPSGSRVGIRITVKATSDLSGSLYEFYAKNNATGTWTKLKGMGPASYAYWTPTKEGTYTLRVRAKGPNSTNNYDSYKDITFKVSPKITTTVKTLTTSVPSGAKKGTKITVKATSDLSNSLYEFYVKENTSNTWVKLKGMGPASYAYWTPSKSGTYTIRVRAKGPNSTNKYDSYKDITFKVIN